MISGDIINTRAGATLGVLAALAGHNILSNVDVAAADSGPAHAAAESHQFSVPIKSLPVAHASSKWCRNESLVTVRCGWIKDHVEDIPGVTFHRRHSCARSEPSDTPFELTCTVERSKSHTVSASIGGEYPIGKGRLSVAVNYDVNESKSVAGTKSIHLKKNQGGKIWWRGEFGERKAVYQKPVRCIIPPHGGKALCSRVNIPMKIAYTERPTGGIDFPSMKFKRASRAFRSLDPHYAPLAE